MCMLYYGVFQTSLHMKICLFREIHKDVFIVAISSLHISSAVACLLFLRITHTHTICYNECFKIIVIFTYENITYMRPSKLTM